MSEAVFTQNELTMMMDITVLQVKLKQATEDMVMTKNELWKLNEKLSELGLAFAAIKPIMGFAVGTLSESGEPITVVNDGVFLTGTDAPPPTFAMGQQPYTQGDLILDLGNGTKGKLTDFDPITGVGTITIVMDNPVEYISVGLTVDGVPIPTGADVAMIDELMSQPDNLMARDF
jgi:hypothetical protein